MNQTNRLKRLGIVTLIIAIIAILLAIFIDSPQEKDAIHLKTDEIVFTIEEDTLSLADSVFLYILEFRIKHPEFVFAQMATETAHFTSRLLKTNNNPMGMNHPRVRATTSYAETNGFATYHSIRDAVIDYALYQNTIISKRHALSDYKRYIGKHYAEDKKYLRIVEQVMKIYEQRNEELSINRRDNI